MLQVTVVALLRNRSLLDGSVGRHGTVGRVVLASLRVQPGLVRLRTD